MVRTRRSSTGRASRTPASAGRRPSRCWSAWRKRSAPAAPRASERLSRRWLLLACLLLPAAGQATAPQRVVSLNLCTDAMLFELARPGQIAAVTRLSRDPALSRFAREAARTPVIHGMAEEVLALAPDLVLAAPDSAAATL